MTLSSHKPLIAMDALIPDQPTRVADEDGQPFCVILSEGTVRAFVDECPHRGHPLSEGTCHEGGHLRCALHGWEFDLSDGSTVSPAAPFRLQRAGVRVVDGYVEITR